MTFRTVCENSNCEQVVADSKFPAGEDRAGRNAELVIAAFAFPKVASLIGIESEATAPGAVRLALGVGPSNALKGFAGLLIGHAGDRR